MRDAQVFASIVDAPPRKRADRAATSERRKSARTPFGVVGLILPDLLDQPHVPLHVSVDNVSVGGVGLRCPVGFPRGRVYRLRIGTGPLFLASRIRIVSSRQRTDGSFDIGAKFV